MFQFFKVNDPFRIIGLFLFLIIWTVVYLVFSNFPLTSTQLNWMLLGERLGDGYFLYQHILDDTGPLSGGFFFIMDFLFGRSPLALELFGRALVFFQVIYWNRTLIKYRVFDENTYLPGIIMLALFHLNFDMLSISPALLGGTFLMLALSQLFSQTLLQKDSSESTLLIGIYGGIATGFHPIYILFLPFLIFGGIAISGFTFRQLLLSLTGYFLPILLISVFYYWNNGLDEAFEVWPLIFFSEKYYYQSLVSWGILAAFPVLLAVIGFFISSVLRGATINQQKQRQLMVVWVIISCIGVIFSKRQASFQWVILLPGLSYLITQFFLNIKNRKIISPAFYLLVIGVPVLSWWYMNQEIQKESTYFVKETNSTEYMGKGIMVLGDDLSPYRYGIFEGPFLNFHLSKLFLEKERSLPQRAKLFQMIKGQSPEIILDQEGEFAKLLIDYPELEREYQVVSPGKYQIK
ncbi:hypothetical protein [Algoriphagus zhangzhouensis]|uniref:Dolichyl-phosphate-mannose-protein mannosyltransferase n=1 Tax=Algoriphagus zhangzhouensis TaxID=1073327 RepID=A0A1M7ZBM6_9BACT|nr:hypothetical protein [Algoriphagus zhangzhouensis]TDY46791.1 hypothetical protein A8938_1240 [Algoriphagus zhangzhouensis]SHO62250.1 hypothetical protein SAMN04488108_2022 [Algoriphagus zhangzhouensis]